MSISAHANPWEHTGHVRLHRHRYQKGHFFITICTHKKYPWFGDVRHGIMGLSHVGSIVADEWAKTGPMHSNIELGAWIVMPNHMHGIMTMHGDIDDDLRDVTTNYLRPPDAGSLAMMINQFKSTCTKRIRHIGVADFAWQPRFHDHIIRDADEYARIEQYILNNPIAWSVKYGV